jgi:hypothetical protein
MNALLRGQAVGELLRLSCLAMTAPALMLALETLLGDPWRFNDYYVYWLAGKIVASGGNPYDFSLLTDFAAADGRTFQLGGPYSYPPPFALLMIPLSALPFELSAWIFSFVSLAVFGLAVAILLCWAPALDRSDRRTRAWAALLAGGYPPISGSLVMGQANLLVFGLLAVGFLLLTRGGRPRTSRELAAGAALGLAAVVKLVPLLLVVPLVLARRWTATAALVGASGAALALSLLAAPDSFRGALGLAVLFEPDSYWTNQSVNGLVSRLLSDSDQTRALVPDLLPIGPAVAASTALLTLLTAAVLWRSRACLRSTVGLGLGLALALVAGSAGAPKNSIWNHTPALLAVWIVLWLGGPACSASLKGVERGLLAAWMAGAFIHQVTGRLPAVLDQAWAGLSTLLVSSALFGLLALWLLISVRLRALSCPAHLDHFPSEAEATRSRAEP